MINRILRSFIPLTLLPFVAATTVPPTPTDAVHGDYVEARTASVFAGACHYNGERVTEGRSAIMAWNIAGGSFHGVDLSGTKVFAAVSCDDNLAEIGAARQSEMIVDASTPACVTAVVDWIKSRCADQLGMIVSVHSEKITFQRKDEVYNVSADGFAALSIQPMPNHECCSQPSLVWYAPLMPLDNHRVGYTVNSEYDAGHVGNAWQRTGENTAFYGAFTR